MSTTAASTKVATKRRQAILTYLNRHGPQTATTLCEKLGLHKCTVRAYIRDMKDCGEISSVESMSGFRRIMLHTALVKKTMVDEKPVIKSELWKTTNLGTHREHPLPNARGQGAVRHRVTIGPAPAY